MNCACKMPRQSAHLLPPIIRSWSIRRLAWRLPSLVSARSAALTVLSSGCTASGISVDQVAESDRCEISTQRTPEVANGLNPYYLKLNVSSNSSEFLNNHIPLDPPLDGLVLLTKASVKDTVLLVSLRPTPCVSRT